MPNPIPRVLPVTKTRLSEKLIDTPYVQIVLFKKMVTRQSIFESEVFGSQLEEITVGAADTDSLNARSPTVGGDLPTRFTRVGSRDGRLRSSRVMCSI
jgi:hypothetical protein